MGRSSFGCYAFRVFGKCDANAMARAVRAWHRRGLGGASRNFVQNEATFWRPNAFALKNGTQPRKSGDIYADETTSMKNADIMNTTGRLSMRRTFLTLLCAMAAFGVLTASYATADLPDEAVATSTQTAVAD